MNNITICIGTTEKSNMIWLYSKAFVSLGYNVITIAEPHPFFKNNYTYNLAKPDWLFNSFKSRNVYYKIVNVILWQASKLYTQIRRNLLYYKLRKKIDIMIVIGDGFFSKNHRDYQYLKSKNKKIVQICYGGDVRCWDAFNQEFKIEIQTIEQQPIENNRFNITLNRLRKAELYADAIFSLPDQHGLGLRPYFKVYLPFECEDYKFTLNNREKPIIVHFESRLPYKGENFLYSAIEILKKEGLQFDFHIHKDMKHNEVIEKLQDADILLDECLIFGPGTLGNEAIACGCALVTKVQKDHFIFPYVCNISEYNILEPLRNFILDKTLRIKNLEIAYQKLKEFNYPKNIALDILEKIKIDRKDFANHTHIPKFYLDKYIIPHGHSLNKKNKENTKLILNEYINDSKKLDNLLSKNLA